MSLQEWSEWFDVGDLIVAKDHVTTSEIHFQARLFERDSDWSPWQQIAPKTMATVLFSSKRETGAGRRWHKVLVSLGDGHSTVGWIDGPGSWSKVIE